MKRLLALSALAVLTLSACKSQTSSSDTIKLGFIGPLTGDAVALGKDMLNGVTLAVKEANAKGGVNGKQVEIVAEDAHCTGGADAANAAQKLVGVDNVVAIVGGLCSSETLAAAPIAEAGKRVLMSPGSSNPSISQAGDYIFRNYPSDALKAVAMAKYINQKGYTKIAIISENTDYCTGLRDALVKEVGTAATFVFNESVDPGTKDFRTLLTRLQGQEFDVFITNANSDGIIAVMVQQFRDQGLKQPILGADTADSQVVVDVGAAAEGMQLINVPTAGEGKPFEQTFTAAYGKPQSSIAWGAYAYDAANILMKAMADVGTDGTAMKDALYKLTYTGVVGTVHFDANGDPVGIPYVVKEIKGGKIVTVQDLPL